MDEKIWNTNVWWEDVTQTIVVRPLKNTYFCVCLPLCCESKRGSSCNCYPASPPRLPQSIKRFIMCLYYVDVCVWMIFTLVANKGSIHSFRLSTPGVQILFNWSLLSPPDPPSPHLMPPLVALIINIQNNIQTVSPNA